jgi:hypothetical protein
MISYAAYKVLHITSVLFVFTSLGALMLAARAGVDRQERKLAGMTHGIALILILVTGFGTLIRLGVAGMPLWVGLKLLIWLTLGGIIVLIRRSPRLGTMLWWILPLLGGAAAYLAIYKPGA